MRAQWKKSPEILLASSSSSRANLLFQAGVKFGVHPADIDEKTVKEAVKHEGGAALSAAGTLAELKAKTISEIYPDALIIGADQILCLDGTWFDKPTTLAQAKRNLQSLRGKTHILVTAAVVVLGGQQLWQTHVSPKLTMRPFSDAFLDRYIQCAGDKILSSVGAYQLEGLGVQLFSQIEGDFFSILGMPLLPLLGFLRERGALIP